MRGDWVRAGGWSQDSWVASHDLVEEKQSLSFLWGDFGGPLVCPKGNSFILAGIVGWGINCTASPPPHPGVYIRVSVYAKWIQEVTGSAGPSAFSPAVLSASTTPLGSLSNGLVCSCLALALVAPLLAGLLLPAL
uniref:Peptidase S1 domain-containing protein n=1 Tax=Gopherus agassizii TaxID=38772 RepID=A0A452GWL6_9SAUR